MITAHEAEYIQERAYLPEQIPAYVTAISGTEPHLIDDFVVHTGPERLIFVGYALDGGDYEEARLLSGLDRARERFRPESLSLIAPQLPPSLTDCRATESDTYYRLALSELAVSQKVRNMLRRADRMVTVKQGPDLFGPEHQQLLDLFLAEHASLPEATRFIFQKTPAYARTGSAWVFEARDPAGELVAFDVADFGPAHYAFYMFNFSSPESRLPGVSDLLLYQIIKRAQRQSKSYLNLGLGINRGITFFKTKWGGQPFLPHQSCTQETTRPAMWSALLDMMK